MSAFLTVSFLFPPHPYFPACFWVSSFPIFSFLFSARKLFFLFPFFSSVTLSPGIAGYDILSFSLDGKEKYIEVKTTASNSDSFEITANEWATAKLYSKDYWIYRVRNIRSESPTLEMIQDPFALVSNGEYFLKPTAFQFIPSDSSVSRKSQTSQGHIVNKSN